MNDVKNVLERARDRAPSVGVDLDGVLRRHERDVARRRIAATALGLGLTVALIGATLFVIGGQRRTSIAGGGDESVDLSLAQGEYYYVRFYDVPGLVYANQDRTTSVNGVTQTWWTLDGSGRIVSSLLDGSGERQETFSSGEFPRTNEFAHTTDLSTDPVTLEQQLRDAISPGGASPEPYDEWASEAATPPPPEQDGAITWGMVRVVDDLLMDPSTSPDEKAALMQVAAALPGMDVRAEGVDPVGRQAIALSIRTEDRLHELWFDPTSDQPLAALDGQLLVIVRAAGITSSETSTDLDRSFVPVDDTRLGPDTLTSPPGDELSAASSSSAYVTREGYTPSG